MTSGSQTVNEQAWAETFTAGMAALDAGNLKKATKDLQDAVEIAGQLGFTDSLTNSLLALGDAQRLSRHYEKAEETFARAIEFSFKHPTGQRIPYAFSLGALGRLYIEQNKIEQARDQLEMAASILRRHRASAEPEFLTVFLALITCYLEQNDFEKADKLSRYTYDLSKSLVGDSDAATLMVMSMCAASADGLGKQRRADILRCQIRTMVSDQKKNGAPDELGIAASMLRQLNRDGVVDTRPIVFAFGGEECVFEREIPAFDNAGTSRFKKERRAVQPNPRLLVVRN